MQLVQRLTTLTQRVIGQIRWTLQNPTAELTRAQAILRYLVDLTRHCTRELHHDRAPQMAAALTYHTLFSLLPTVALMLVIMRVFVTPDQLESFRNTGVDLVMQWLGDTGTSDIGSQPATSIQTDFGQTASALEQNLQRWLNQLQNVNFKSIGLVGVLLFIYAATGLLAMVERSFNLIYGASSNRPLYLRLPMYYTVITLGPMILLLGQYMQGRFMGWLYTESWTNWLVGPLAMATPLLTAWSVLLAMYTLLPNTRVQLRPAVFGSFIAASGWTIGVELFGIYVRGAATATLYGAMAVLPLFLLWLWITWLIVLFGLVLAHTLQGMRGHKFASQPLGEYVELLLDPKWMIPMMALIGKRFAQGQATRPQSLARSLALPVRAVNQMIGQLQQEGLVHQIDDRDAIDPRYALARPAEQIELRQLLEVGHRISRQHAQASQIPCRQFLGDLNEAESRTAAKQTLASILHCTGAPNDI